MHDLISRQAAIEDIKECAQAAHSNYEWDMEQGYINAIECLEELPSAQRTGRWKVSELPKGKMKYCSECGFGQYIADERQYNFCPNCGALMDGEIEGKSKK